MVSNSFKFLAQMFSLILIFNLRYLLYLIQENFMETCFLQITAYFMELATPHTEEAIKLVDKVGDFEWLIQKYEIDGAAALMLDLSLDTPMIIIPRNSTSKESVDLLFIFHLFWIITKSL